MPTIKLTDRLGFEIDAEINPHSSIARYIKQLTKFKFPKLKLAELQNSTLDGVIMLAIRIKISFVVPVGVAENTEVTGW